MSDAEDGYCTVMFKPWSVDSHDIHRSFQRDLQKEIKKSLQPVSSRAAIFLWMCSENKVENHRQRISHSKEELESGDGTTLLCSSTLADLSFPHMYHFCLVYRNIPSIIFFSSGLPSPSLPVWFPSYSEHRICLRDAHPVNRSSMRTWSNLKPACALFLRFKQDFGAAQA